MNLKKIFDQINDTLKHPMVEVGMDWLGDFVMGHMFTKRQEGDKIKREIDPVWLRREAPRIYARTKLDENLLREITYSRHLFAGHRVAIFDNWGPDPATIDPDPLLGEIGPYQWDDCRLTLVEAMFSQDGPNLIPLKGVEREAKIKELCEFLTEIAQLPNPYKLRRMVQLRYCRSRETDYKMVMFERFRRKTFATMADFANDFQNWINDPGAKGYEAIAATIATGATAATLATGVFTRNAANNLNNLADRTRPRWLGRFIR